GFYPTLDVAATIIRARATFSAHPPLYGMWSSGSSWAGHEIHFPGPILLYLLAVPVHLFGNTWGPLLGMAVINAFFVLMTGWVIYRRLGVNAALLGFLLLNVFLWSLGSENLIDPRPMEMVTIPFLCFLLLAWLVTSGEIDALPALAIVANYLFLNHLVMALQIPVIGLCAVVGVALWIRRTRADPGGPEPDTKAPSQWRRLRRRLLQTGAITFIMWLPTLIQQFTTSPGNLNLLISASGQHRDPVGSYVAGYNATVRLIAQPTFWFRGRFDESDFPGSLRTLTVWDVLAGVVVVGLIAGLGFAAWRRRDRLSLGALAVAVVAIAISIETVTQAPRMWGFPMQYLRSLWGLAAFVWFAIAFSAYRTVAPHVQVRAAQLAGIAAIAFGVLGLSYANFGSATDMDNRRFARAVVADVVPQLTDRGTVRVTSGPDFTSQRYLSTLLLGLDTAGVHFCVDHHTAQQYGSQHDCAREADVSVYLQAPDHPGVNRGRLIAQVPLLSEADHAELARTEKVFERWLDGRDQIALTAEAERIVVAGSAEGRRTVEAMLRPPDGDLSGLMRSDRFRTLIGLDHSYRADHGGSTGLLADPNAPVNEMLRYFELTDPSLHGNIWVYERAAT
ncbi:MAG TPA: hypothetical protein VFN21_06145, partial [Acidimicrobiales bacterium]|nr:hypothetical protein [Acidimicrobiales bacterium]